MSVPFNLSAGTTNFVHGFPFVCVSIGLAINKVPVVGVVYNPIMNELFEGTRGGGAFLNGKPIRTSGVTGMGQALLLSELGCGRESETIDAVFDRFRCVRFTCIHSQRKK